MSEQLALLPEYLGAHLRLTLVALLLGFAVSVPTGIWLTRRREWEQGVLGVVSVIQTIPGLALLAIMVPLLAGLASLVGRFGLELRSIGYLPAIIALTLYSMLPILRNTLAGITGVDPALIEAARGVGMTPSQRLWRVELPLALPVIVAGLRTATVWVVGTATLSTPVGATSLGNYIFSGLQTRNTSAVLVGCVAAAGLALLLDGLIRQLEVGIASRRPKLAGTALALLALLYAGTAASWALERIGHDDRIIAIGSKPFTEQYVLAEIVAGQVEQETGLPTRSLQSLGSTVAFDALRSGDLDVYVDYTGTVWATIMHRDAPGVNRDRVLDEVRRFLVEEHGIVLVGALGFENTYALGLTEARARELGVARISQLAAHAPNLEIGGDYEFFQRPEWASIERVYGLDFRKERSMDAALMYQAVVHGEVDVIGAYSTDGRIAAFDLRLLEDDRSVIPPYDAVILASPRLTREQPDALHALDGLVGAIDEREMQRMNLAVDRDKRSPRDVAREFLAQLRRPN